MSLARAYPLMMISLARTTIKREVPINRRKVKSVFLTARLQRTLTCRSRQNIWLAPTGVLPKSDTLQVRCLCLILLMIPGISSKQHSIGGSKVDTTQVSLPHISRLISLSWFVDLVKVEDQAEISTGYSLLPRIIQDHKRTWTAAKCSAMTFNYVVFFF